MARPVQVIWDSSGDDLVALIDPDQPMDFWPSWRIDPAEGVYGPNLVGNWCRFIPSDWRDAAEPFPALVRQVADWVATNEALDEFLANIRWDEWMLNPGRSPASR